MEENRTSSFLSGLFWGGITGFILGVLFAPRAGVETRELLKEKGEEFEMKVKEASDEIKAKGRDILTGSGVEIQEESGES